LSAQRIDALKVVKNHYSDSRLELAYGNEAGSGFGIEVVFDAGVVAVFGSEVVGFLVDIHILVANLAESATEVEV